MKNKGNRPKGRGNKGRNRSGPFGEADNDEQTPNKAELYDAQESMSGLSREEKCDLIADLSERILEDPNSAFHAERQIVGETNSSLEGETQTTTIRLPSKVQKLLDLARPYKNGDDEYVASLAIMSLLAVFQDILPSYRVRLPSESERASKLSKETKQLWDYERAILTHYQQYLQLLEKSWATGESEDGSGPSRTAITAMLSLCELFKSSYHFNFRNNILTAVVRQMNNRKCPQVSDSCCQAIEYVFEKDNQGEVAMETARQVAKLIKDYKGILLPKVVATFSKLPLRVHSDEAEAAKIASRANAKRRKKDRELAGIEDELKEASGSVDKIVLARCQSETLQAVILSYFRILKSNDMTTKQDLLPVALEGLAKFSHLINIDTVVDLLDVLRQLLLLVDSLPLEASLNCILTAFQTLHGPGREMQIDVKEYVTPLYTQLGRLATEGHSRQNTDTVLRCLDAAFVKRTEYSTVRVAAFLKQILTVAMHTPAYASVPLIALARQMLQKYPSAQQMMDGEGDVITSGQYTPDVSDPEYSNPFSTSAWEISNLKFHFNPVVQQQANGAGSLKMLQLPMEAPNRLFGKGKEELEGVYIRFSRSSKRHPLAPKGKGRQQLRFITPRKKQMTLLEAPLPSADEKLLIRSQKGKRPSPSS